MRNVSTIVLAFVVWPTTRAKTAVNMITYTQNKTMRS